MNVRRRSEREQRFNFALGQAIAQARKRLGISGVQLASYLEISQNSLYGIELGRRCSFFLVVEIAKTLGINLAELMPDVSLFSSSFRSNQKNDKTLGAHGERAVG
jgi:ribosome-binding protein aMBF1 (putative translation factor)